MSDDLPDAVTKAYLSPESYPVELKVRAYDRFLHSSLDITGISQELEIPRHILSIWVREGHWMERKQKIEEAFFQEAEAKFREFLRDEKLPEAKAQLKLARVLQDALAKLVEHQTEKGTKPLNDMTLRRLAEALSAMTGVSARAVGITDRPALETAPRDQETGNRKVPLVVIGVAPGAQVQLPPSTPAGRTTYTVTDIGEGSKHVTTLAQPDERPAGGDGLPDKGVPPDAGPVDAL